MCCSSISRPKVWDSNLEKPEPESRYPSSTLFRLCFGVSSLKLNSRKQGAHTIEGLLGNPDYVT